MTSHKKNQGFIIAIDGPVASGKGTIARLLSDKLKGFYIDTGISFRCLALYCLEHEIAFDDEKAIEKILPKIKIQLLEERVILNGDDVTNAIRTPEVGRGASPVSGFKSVRNKFKEVWRQSAEMMIKKGKIVIAEGRDMGTVVFPNAQLKIYLNANLAIRAERRRKQYLEKGEVIAFEQILRETRDRDLRDSSRKIAPLTLTPEKYDYFILDDSDITEEQTLSVIMEELKKRKLV